MSKQSKFRFTCTILGLLALGLLLAPGGDAPAQPKGPPAPDKYNVKLRYKIDTVGLAHVAQFDEMVAGLKKLGFEFVPSLDDLPPTIREDVNRNMLTGTIPADKAVRLVGLPYVMSVQLVPEPFALPKDPDQRVQVQIDLTFEFSLSKQREFTDQVRALLTHFQFIEMVGYDHRGFTGKPFTRLRGSIPVEHLETLLKDIRREPSGWFAPLIPPDQLPEPFGQVNPVLITTVIADPAPVASKLRPVLRDDPDFRKIDPNLWELVKANKPHSDDLRIELILATLPAAGDPLWQVLLQKAAPRLHIEDILGNIVTGVFPVPYDEEGKVIEAIAEDDYNQIKNLAKLPFVSAVRLPQPVQVQVSPTLFFPGDNDRALQKAGLIDFHKKGHQGKGVRVAILDSDFRGWQEAMDQGKLPSDALLVDLTRERNVGLVPDPVPGDADALGHGTQCAMAAALAAPGAKILLVRIDPASPIMLKTAVNYIFGDHILSPSLALRYDELADSKIRVQQFREQVTKERKIVLDIFEDDKDLREQFNFLGAPATWMFLSRDWLFQREAELEKAEKEYLLEQQTFFQFLQEVKALRGTDILSCSLVWNDSYPLGTRSPLTKWLDDKFRPKYVLNPAGKKVIQKQKPLWFQSVGNTRGQSWYGLYRDADGNGVMEFAAPGAKLPPGSWTPELNFLAWQSWQDQQALDLPGDTKFRVSLQWTEPHDPAYFFSPDDADWYLKPVADLQVVVLRQRDPAGTMLSEDDFEEVARSVMSPQRLDNFPGSSTYELFTEWTTTQPGRYAVRIEKWGTYLNVQLPLHTTKPAPFRWLLVPDPKTATPQFFKVEDLAPTGLRPLGTPTLPNLEKQWDLQPRLFVQAVAGNGLTLGRPVFRDFTTDQGSLGVPGDGRVLISVGAADFDGKSEPFSALGPPVNVDLFPAPAVLAYGRLNLVVGNKNGPALGTSLATPFAAGAAAVYLSSGTTPAEFLEHIQQQRQKMATKD